VVCQFADITFVVNITAAEGDPINSSPMIIVESTIGPDMCMPADSAAVMHGYIVAVGVYPANPAVVMERSAGIEPDPHTAGTIGFNPAVIVNGRATTVRYKNANAVFAICSNGSTGVNSHRIVVVFNTNALSSVAALSIVASGDGDVGIKCDIVAMPIGRAVGLVDIPKIIPPSCARVPHTCKVKSNG
jgi:hypothetical protein